MNFIGIVEISSATPNINFVFVEYLIIVVKSIAPASMYINPSDIIATLKYEFMIDPSTILYGLWKNTKIRDVIKRRVIG